MGSPGNFDNLGRLILLEVIENTHAVRAAQTQKILGSPCPVTNKNNRHAGSTKNLCEVNEFYLILILL